jgi:outer membrane protein assembly factor BamE (lipoprotein component of BamABCDE complex)
MKTIKAITLQIVFLGLCLCLWGCATAHSTAGRDFDSTKASQIVNGKTTSDEIVTMFGTPYSKQPETDGGERWIYSYVNATAHAEGVFVMHVTTTGTKKNLNILFNKDKIVVNFLLDEGPIDPQKTDMHQF